MVVVVVVVVVLLLLLRFGLRHHYAVMRVVLRDARISDTRLVL